MTLAMPHRVRSLRWRASAAAPAQAFALRKLLRERGDEVQAVLARTLDSMATGAEIWHLPRLELRLAPTDVETLETDFIRLIERALHDALANPALWRLPARGSAQSSTAPTAPRASLAADGARGLLHFLRHGLLPWTWAGLEPEAAQALLRDAAVQATRGLIAGTLSSPLVAWPLRARLGALLRWLPLLPADLRQRWLDHHRAVAPLAELPIAAPRADATVEWHALWLAWPAQSTSHDALAPWTDDVVDAMAWLGDARAMPPSTVQALQAAFATHRGRAAATVEASVVPAAARLARPDEEAPAHDAGTDAETSLAVPLAGLVLLHPYLPRLLAGCKLLSDDGRNLPATSLPRACSLLHALACGGETVHEHRLPLIKLLFGQAPDAPLDAVLPALEASDRDEVDALLAAVREHWPALRGTGTDGLRLSFLQRRGQLRRLDAGWLLRLEAEPFDMLLTSLPWSIERVKLPWMAAPLHTEWPTS